MNQIESFYSQRTGLWEVRLEETVAEKNKYEAEKKARMLLVAYHEASKMITSLVVISKKVEVERFNILVNENVKLRQLLQDAIPHIECVNGGQSGLITEIGQILEESDELDKSKSG